MRYVFGDCVLDTTLYVLHRAGHPVRVRPKVFHLLVYLLRQRERVVTKQELCAQVWLGQAISAATVESTLAAGRRALGDCGKPSRYIHTLHGYGYRFVAPVEECPEPPAWAADEPRLLAADTPTAAWREGLQTAADESQLTQKPTALDLHSPGAAERKLVTVLCCALSSPPETSATLDTLHQQLGVLHGLVHREAAHYGGTVQPVVGTQVLVVFGVPVAYEDHAQRAVLAALEIQHRLHQGPPAGDRVPAGRPRVCLSVHTGPVAVGGLHHEAADTAVVGETLTYAMALQAAAPPGALLCSAATARWVRGLVRLAAVAAGAGRRAPLVYQIRGLRVYQGPWGGPGGRRRSPFVGRHQELTTLQTLLAQAERGRGQVVGVVGEPGLGKSRLLYEFRQRLQNRSLTYLAAGCHAYTQATPYGPLRMLLQRQCGLTDADAPAMIRTKVERALARGGIDPVGASPYLLQLLTVPGETTLTATHSPQMIRTHTISLLVQLALQSARQRPLVLEVENLHWLDPSSEEVLTALVERLAHAALLLLVSYRPGYRLPWLDTSAVTQVTLTPLTPTASRQVVQANLRPAQVTDALVQTLVARAAGNPFFLEELARTAADHKAARGLPREVPETVQAVLAARIDRLPPPAKRLLQVAAVIGTEVPAPLLQAVADLPADQLAQHLTRLQAAAFLEACGMGPDQVYTFRHFLVQEVVYQSLIADARQQLHQRTAQCLVTQGAGAAIPERVAQHYTAAGSPEQAIGYWQRAGQQALQRSAHREAVAHCTTGLALLATLPETPARDQQELALQLALGPAVIATRGRAASEVEQIYARARVLCDQMGETPQRVLALHGAWQFSVNRGALSMTRVLGQQLLQLAQRERVLSSLLVAHDVLGTTCFLLGDYAAAWTHGAQGMARIAPTVARTLAFRYGLAPEVRCLAVAALTLWCLGYPTQAVRCSQEALVLAQTLTHPPSLMFAQHWAALLHHHRQEVPALQAQADALLALATAQEAPLFIGLGTCWQHWALAMQCQDTGGLVPLHQGLAAVLATGQMGAQPHWLVLLAEAAGHTGQVAEGLHLLTKALMAFDATGRGDMLSEAYRLQGALLLRQTPLATGQAEAHFQQALAIARRQQAKSWELRAALSLSRLWQQQSKRADAYNLLAPIYGWFTEGFDTADLQEAKALLEELGG
jgi:DNA-binding winged helix-turn-helix (wHTH) protein/predicted ATPase